MWNRLLSAVGIFNTPCRFANRTGSYLETGMFMRLPVFLLSSKWENTVRTVLRPCGPTFQFAWAILSEEKLSWSLTIHNIVNITYIQHTLTAYIYICRKSFKIYILLIHIDKSAIEAMKLVTYLTSFVKVMFPV